MSKRTTKIVLISVIIALMIGIAVCVYIFFLRGPIVGKIEFGTRYQLKEIRPTERFKGASMSTDSYFQINNDKKTGKLYLKDLNATSAPIPFIVTNYQEKTRETIIDFEYIISNGDETEIHFLRAVSNESEIRIKTVETHGIHNIIAQKPHQIEPLDYNVTILVFSKEVA